LSDYFEKYQKRKLITANISVVVSISIVLFLLGILGFFLLNSKSITNHFKEKIVISIFFNDKAKITEIKSFEKGIRLEKEVKNTKFVPKKEAAKVLKKEIGENFIDFLGYNPLQNNLEVVLKGNFVTEKNIQRLKNKWQKNHIVSNINYEYYKPLLKVLNQNIKKMSFWIILISSVFIILVFLLINSAIRLSIYSKRFSIRTMQLVGATGSFIRKPFYNKAVVLAFIGATIASVGMASILYSIDKYFPDFKFLSDTKLLIILFGSIYFIGIFITIISTFFATRHFLNLSSEHLHY